MHLILGFASIKKDIIPAIRIRTDVFCVGSHATEVGTARKHIEFISGQNKVCHGVMMSHNVDARSQAVQTIEHERFVTSATKVMHSARHFVPSDVRERIRSTKDSLHAAFGFDAPNNLDKDVTKALMATDEGTQVTDGSLMGFFGVLDQGMPDLRKLLLTLEDHLQVIKKLLHILK